MPNRLKKIAALTLQIYGRLSRDQIGMHAAALAFYTVLSLAPFLMGIVLLGYFFSEEKVSTALESLGEILGESSQPAFEMVWSEVRGSASSGWAGFFSVVGIFLFSSAIFFQLQQSLNRIFQIKTQAISQWALKRLLSIGLIFAVVLVLVLLSTLTDFLYAMKSLLPFDVHGVSSLVSFLSLFVAFSLLYRWLPDTRVRWMAVFPAAILVTGLIEFAKVLFGYYLQHSATLSLYGAVGTLPVFLMWVYISSYIFFVGAELVHYLNSKSLDL